MPVLVPVRLLLSEIHDLAWRYVPAIAADDRLYTCGPRSWWPAHEIGHFLVATTRECRQRMFGIDGYEQPETPRRHRYLVTRELAATSISQRLLRHAHHAALADEEIQYTSEDTLDCSFERWCKDAVAALLRANSARRLPATPGGLKTLLERKVRAVGTPTFGSLQEARAAHRATRADRELQGA